MELSIVVVNWNTRDLLRQCLDSIYATVNGIAYEVIVVDNGSTDGSVEMIQSSFPHVRLIRNQENHGFAAANNQAIRTSCGHYMLLLNSDAVLLRDAAQRIVAFLDSHPTAGAVGGKIINPDGTFQSSYADFPGLLPEILLVIGLSRWLLPASYPSYPESQSLQQCRVHWVGGALLAVRREVIESVGLLDESYFMYVEETDWCYRIVKAGWEIHYLPEAQAIHWSGGSFRRVPERKRAQLYRSKWLFFSRHRGWLCAVTFLYLVRWMSLLKLVGWALAGLSWSSPQRQYARQNVTSYGFLLANL